MNYFCCDDLRRTAVINHPELNGIDFIEVDDNPANANDIRQTTLLVHFLKALLPGVIELKNVEIIGGERITGIKITSVSLTFPTSPPSSPPDINSENILVVKVKEAGDFSGYTLKLVSDKDNQQPPLGFDPVLSSIDFSFKVLCPSDFDCKPAYNCLPKTEPSPAINYLSKDYATFRQIMLDRMALLLPDWKERHPADPGIMLVELLAYTGDFLSYRQDAIATEAYLGTARKRISVCRHARLVDYNMHDGCNARTWVHLEVNENTSGLILAKNYNGEATMFLSTLNNFPTVFRSDSEIFAGIAEQDLKVFEMLHDITLYGQHNQMQFYTWLRSQCCLPAGSTNATLDGYFPNLAPGDVLIFSEVLGAATGRSGDADPAHCHPVRITNVSFSFDPLAANEKTLTEITWHPEDALPFPLCISSIDEKGESVIVSVALGNNVLADHGQTIREKLPSVPLPGSLGNFGLSVSKPASAPCERKETIQVQSRYHPQLSHWPVTQAVVSKITNIPTSAYSSRQGQSQDILPCIILEEAGFEWKWYPQHDLLNSNYNDPHFVVEVESDGSTWLRFGNDVQGKNPSAGTLFTATYRLGNGLSGNIGAKSLSHLVTNDPGFSNTNNIIKSISNPLAAIGGTEPESIENARLKAPIAFRKQERAVTMADYEDISIRSMLYIQRSAASLRWTGSWRTVFLTADRLQGLPVGKEFEIKLRGFMENYRMAGQDLEVDSPRFVSLEIEMNVCVNKNYFRSDVKAALLETFSNRKLFNGMLGIFHPDNFSFGQTVYLSRVYAEAQQVKGVDNVSISKFQRQGENSTEALGSGKLLLARLEIARLDNDRDFPEHGVFNLIMKGGK